MGTSLEVQGLRLHASITGGTRLITGWGIKIPRALQQSQKENKVREAMEAGGFQIPPKRSYFSGAIKDTFYSYNSKILI